MIKHDIAHSYWMAKIVHGPHFKLSNYTLFLIRCVCCQYFRENSLCYTRNWHYQTTLRLSISPPPLHFLCMMISCHEHTSHIIITLCKQSPVTGGFPVQRVLAMQNFDCFFVVSLDTLLKKQSSYPGKRDYLMFTWCHIMSCPSHFPPCTPCCQV